MQGSLSTFFSSSASLNWSRTSSYVTMVPTIWRRKNEKNKKREDKVRKIPKGKLARKLHKRNRCSLASHWVEVLVRYRITIIFNLIQFVCCTETWLCCRHSYNQPLARHLDSNLLTCKCVFAVVQWNLIQRESASSSCWLQKSIYSVECKELWMGTIAEKDDLPSG